MESVLQEVQAMLREQYSLTESQVSASQTLASLGIDSMATIEFMYHLEDKFSISLSQERGKLETVSDIAEIVERALSEKAKS